jgi:hypothetical protein
MPPPFFNLVILYLFVAVACSSRSAVFISEFMADNTKTLQDEDGNYSVGLRLPTVEPLRSIYLGTPSLTLPLT